MDVGYIETQLKRQPQVTTDDIWIANGFDIQLHEPWEDDILSQSDEAATIPVGPDTQDLMNVDPQDLNEATQSTLSRTEVHIALRSKASWLWLWFSKQLFPRVGDHVFF